MHSGIGNLVRSQHPGALRPWLDEDDARAYLTAPGPNGALYTAPFGEHQQGPTGPARLTRRQWMALDEVQGAALREVSPVLHALLGYGRTQEGFSPLAYRPAPAGRVPPVLHYHIEGGEGAIDQEGLPQPPSDTHVLPLPLVRSSFLMTSPDDHVQAIAAARLVGVGMEGMLLGLGRPHEDGRHRVYGLRNHPNRVAHTLSRLHRDAKGSARADLTTMTRLLRETNCHGPYLLVRHKDDLSWEGAETWGGCGPVALHVASQELPVGEALLVHLSSETVQVVVVQDPVAVQLRDRYVYWGVVVPRIRANTGGVAGVVHATEGPTDEYVTGRDEAEAAEARAIGGAGP